MSNAPLMPMATAVWLVENTTLTFKQIAEFCNLHELEVKGIADGDVAKGIKAYNPILAGQLSRDEIVGRLADLQKRYPQAFMVDITPKEEPNEQGTRGELLEHNPKQSAKKVLRNKD